MPLDVVQLYVDETIEPGREAAALLLAALLGSFLFIRTSARLARSPRVTWWPGSVQTSGGLHIHHLVFGIVIVLLVGFLTFAFDPDNPWLSILAVLFGIGAGLTLDEFALWLHLEDVYWSDEGRRSVDAVVIAVVLAGLLLVGLPLDYDEESGSLAAVLALAAVQLAICTVTFLKGKVVLGLVGLFVPIFAYVGAIRLARPESPWARWRYKDNEGKMARAKERSAKVERRRTRLLDMVGGAPSTSDPGATDATTSDSR